MFALEFFSCMYLYWNLEKHCIWTWFGWVVFVFDPEKCIWTNLEAQWRLKRLVVCNQNVTTAIMVTAKYFMPE